MTIKCFFPFLTLIFKTRTTFSMLGTIIATFSMVLRLKPPNKLCGSKVKGNKHQDDFSKIKKICSRLFLFKIIPDEHFDVFKKSKEIKEFYF